MNLETMYFTKEGRIGYLTPNRPQLLNAMNYQGALDLNQAGGLIRDEPDIRLVLINRASRDNFDNEVNVLVEKHLRVCPEGARQAKMLLNMSFDTPHGQLFDEYLQRQRIALASADHQEALAAYREKHEPNFST
jgi:enoyl-CoA hydratase/carnithine racemase